MQWICGWSGLPWSTKTLGQPLHGVPLGDFRNNAWSIGFPANLVRHVHSWTDPTVLTVVGDCLATTSELERGIVDASAGRYQDLAMWPGSYLTIVEHPGKTLVFGSLDGSYLVHFVQTSLGTYWSSAATPLAALVGDNVDAARLACDIVVDGMPAHAGKSPFRGLQTVPPGSYLELVDGQPDIERWYRPMRMTFDDTATHLRAVLDDAVARRFPMTADLSGGLDSSALVVLAALHGPIDVMTYHEKWSHTDDLPFAQAVAEHLPTITQHLDQLSDDVWRYGDLSAASLPWTDLPSLGVIVSASFRRQYRNVWALGSQRHMHGEGGDLLFSPPPFWLLDLYRGGRRRDAGMMAMQWARSRYVSPFGIVKTLAQAQRMTYSGCLRQAAYQLRRDHFAAARHAPQLRLHAAGLTGEAAWLSPDRIEPMAEELEAFASTVDDAVPISEMRDWLIIRQLTASRATSRALAAEYGISEAAPYFDAEVLRACLSLPGYDRANFSVFKPLIKAAVPEPPPSLLMRTTKGNYSGGVVQAFTEHYEQLKDFIMGSRLVAEGVFEQAALLARLDDLRLGKPVSQYGFDQFVATEIWLQGLDLNHASWWKEPDVR